MQILPWIIPPLLGAIIAFSTNWIAILMLFRPHHEKRIFGWRIPFTPGLVPREKEKLGRKLGEAIERHLLTPEVLTQTLADPASWNLPKHVTTDTLKHLADTLLPAATGAVTDFSQRFPFLDEKLAELTRHVADTSISGLASVFVKKEKIYPSIKEWLAGYLSDEANREALRARLYAAIDRLPEAEALAALPTAQVLKFIVGHIAPRIPISDMVAQKMATYDVAEAEKMILSVVGRELKIIVMLGGVFGFFIGLLSLIPLLLP